MIFCRLNLVVQGGLLEKLVVCGAKVRYFFWSMPNLVVFVNFNAFLSVKCYLGVVMVAELVTWVLEWLIIKLLMLLLLMFCC